MPRRRIPYIVLVAALLSLLIYQRRDEMDTEDIRKDRHWVIKTRNTLRYDIVFGGDSRVFRGVSPAHFTAELNGRSAYNYAYWANGYGSDYLDGIEGKIDTSSSLQMIILGVSPHSLTEKTAQSPHYHWELKRSRESVLQTIHLSRVQQYFLSYEIATLGKRLLGKDRFQNKRIYYHPDGWVETWWVRPDTTHAARSYKNLFEGDPVSEEVIDNLLDYVQGWTARGIYVVGFRPPASGTIRTYEEERGGFREAIFVEKFRGAGGIWIEVDPGAYETYDGSHLEHQSAMRLSADLARMIRSHVPEL